MFSPTLTCPKSIKESYTSVRNSSSGNSARHRARKAEDSLPRLSVPVAIYSRILAVTALHHRKALLCRPSDV